MEKFVNFFKSASALYSFMLILLAVSVFAADTRYMTLEKHDIEDIKQLRRDISELEVRMNFTTNENDRQMFETLIKMKENQIKEIKGE